MKNCQPRRVSLTLTCSTERKNLVNPNMGQTQFLRKFYLLGFFGLQEIYVINTRTLSASTEISLILQYYYYCYYLNFCLCLFASGLMVCLGGIYVRRINEISRLRCRAIIIGCC